MGPDSSGGDRPSGDLPIVPFLGGAACHSLASSYVTPQMWMSAKTSRAGVWEASARTRLAPTSASAPGASSWPMAPCVRVSGSGLPTRGFEAMSVWGAGSSPR